MVPPYFRDHIVVQFTYSDGKENVCKYVCGAEFDVVVMASSVGEYSFSRCYRRREFTTL